MHSRKAVMEAKEAAKSFLKAVEAWEKEHSSKEEEQCRAYLTKAEFEKIKDGCGFGNRRSGEIKAASIILTRRLADMRKGYR